MSNENSHSLHSLLTPQFILVLFATATFGLAFSTYFLLPKYLAVELGANAATIGSISAISMLASVIAMPFIGVQVDLTGRKVFGIAGASIFALACIGFVFIDSVGPLLWLVRILQGTAFTLFYVAISTLATDITPVERRGQAIGLFGAVMISTNAIGPALSEWGAEAFGWDFVFTATVLAATLSAALTFRIHENSRQHEHHDSTSMLEVLRRPGMFRILIVASMAGWAMGSTYTFYQPWALTRGFEQVSSYLIAFAMFAMFVRIGLGGLADRVGRLRIATIAVFLYIGAPLSLIYLDLFGLFFTGSILGLAHGLFFPALNAVALDRALDSERGKSMAAYHGAFNIGFAAGSYFLGFVALAAGYPMIFKIAGIACFAAFVLLLGAAKKSDP